jgi:hypothetical protein
LHRRDHMLALCQGQPDQPWRVFVHPRAAGNLLNAKSPTPGSSTISARRACAPNLGEADPQGRTRVHRRRRQRRRFHQRAGMRDRVHSSWCESARKWEPYQSDANTLKGLTDLPNCGGGPSGAGRDPPRTKVTKRFQCLVPHLGRGAICVPIHTVSLLNRAIVTTS